MRVLVLFILSLVFLSSAYSQKNDIEITGYVTNNEEPIPSINVHIKGTTFGVKTNAQGKYTIMARPKDVLVFSHVGMQPVEIIVEDVTSILNIKMYLEILQLDEVVVQKRKRKTKNELLQEYFENKNLIKTTFGILDGTQGFTVRVIDGSELNPGAIDVLSALQGKFPGLQIKNWTNPQTGITERTAFLSRSSSFKNAKPVLFEVDGAISNRSPFLALDNIERIALISGLAGINRYGSIASGGVIIINTKHANVHREPDSNELYDYAKLRNNVFANDAQLFTNGTLPNYLLELKAAKTEKDALTIYKKQLKLYGKLPYYLLDATSFFLTTWNNHEKYKDVSNFIRKEFAHNAVVLKALAYKHEELGELQTTVDIYKEIFKLRPSYAQSYRDLANIYVETGNYSNALNLYARYITSRKIDTLDFTLKGIDTIIKTEFNNLISRKSKEMGITTSAIIGNEKNVGIRLVFEWNNNEAEFEIQFVNPKKHFYIWSHTIETNKERITDEKLKGYSSEQFLIDENLIGTWQINLKYFGNKSYAPTYIKVTVYYNYDTPYQKKTSHFFRLSEQNINQQLIRVVNKPIPILKEP